MYYSSRESDDSSTASLSLSVEEVQLYVFKIERLSGSELEEMPPVDHSGAVGKQRLVHKQIRTLCYTLSLLTFTGSCTCGCCQPMLIAMEPICCQEFEK